jgi:hypothetical protein
VAGQWGVAGPSIVVRRGKDGATVSAAELRAESREGWGRSGVGCGGVEEGGVG